jgi:transcriptional regulator with PAS, ATPase and Fis domain
MIGTNERMQEIYEEIEKSAKTNVRVLITGETGTGKELVARAIHKLGERNEKPFIKMNCAAIPSELIESELFGYRKGAFTGAYQNKTGRFQAADHGILFLDEIGDMSPETQAKVLRAIEEGEVQPIGSTDTVQMDVRIITATNKNLGRAVQDGQFREDLYYRLNVVNIDLPPLRERKEDIPDLVDYFITGFCEEFNKTRLRITERASQFLLMRDWPGNIRELRNLMEKLVVFSNDEIVDSHHIKHLLGMQQVTESLEIDQSLKEAKKQFERDYIQIKLAANHGNITQTANILGISRTDLYRRMKNLGMNNIAKGNHHEDE